MNDCASEETSNAKDKLLANLKKEVKKIVEECVMLKCVHEESAGVTSLCVSVDACLSYGLRRRALGLFKTRYIIEARKTLVALDSPLIHLFHFTFTLFNF